MFKTSFRHSLWLGWLLIPLGAQGAVPSCPTVAASVLNLSIGLLNSVNDAKTGLKSISGPDYGGYRAAAIARVTAALTEVTAAVPLLDSECALPSSPAGSAVTNPVKLPLYPGRNAKLFKNLSESLVAARNQLVVALPPRGFQGRRISAVNAIDQALTDLQITIYNESCFEGQPNDFCVAPTSSSFVWNKQNVVTRCNLTTAPFAGSYWMQPEAGPHCVSSMIGSRRDFPDCRVSSFEYEGGVYEKRCGCGNQATNGFYAKGNEPGCWDQKIYQPAHPLYADHNLDECKTLGTGSDACLWRHYYTSGCLQNKCAKLVIYFSGGQMSCPNPIQSPQAYLARYAAGGYVAVCARIFEREISSGQFPFHREASRVDALVKAITTDPAIRQGWNGEQLLFSGVSHGATAAVVAMARNDFDASAAHWRGSKVTGACFFDGIYNSRDNLGRAFTQSCSIYPRAFGRYCPSGAISANRATWPAPDTCQFADVGLDNPVAVDVRNFAIRQWKLVECGSALDYCGADLVHAQPQVQLCQQLGADPTKSCTLGSFPSVSHDNCGALPQTMEACRTWFDEL